MQKVLNKTKFEQYHWHDSEIRSISIDRKNPGINDTIIFDMDWYERGSGILIFEDIAPECVDSAFIADDNDSDLIAFNHNWKERLTDKNNRDFRSAENSAQIHKFEALILNPIKNIVEENK